jgi:hypothetical protein
MLGANVRGILFVALPFEVLLHFFQVAAKRRTGRAKRPAAGGASPSLHASGFDPYHLSHSGLPELLLALLLK